ncbi:MAG: DNA primase [Candidatus Liptonbacteria bacterium]|nr:DNA primase [Candidatus Liptonbacteria bacterium]
MEQKPSELIKEKLDIVDFLRGYLSIQPAGKNFKATCPFHKEKTPSFMVSPERQSWHCFGCGLGGDIFGFVMRYENLEFGEALRLLAEKSGVELKRLNPAEYKFTGLLYELNDKARDFWRDSLRKNEVAKKYLADRGLTQATIDEFELGWAENVSEALGMHLLKAGYAPDDLLRAGLSFKTERGLLLDRFRGRIMFPIHNHFGRVVGFTGRILPQLEKPETAKYVNSPETAIFNKSRLLYGFWKSKNHIRDSGCALLVEGQMDFLMAFQAGVKNAVASSGTALTPDHLRTLRKLSEEIVLSFDNDEAGSAAAERAIDLAEASDFSVKVLTFDAFKDPADMVASGGDLQKEIGKAVEAPLFYFEKYLPKKEQGFSRPEDLKKLRIVLGKLKSIVSPVLRGHWFHELSKRTGLDEKILIEEAERIEMPKTDSERLSSSDADVRDLPRRYSRKELIGERLLRAAVAVQNFGLLEGCAPHLALHHQGILKALERGERTSVDQKLDDLLNFIMLGAEKLDDKEIAELKRELAKEHVRERRTELALAVRRAEETGDEPAMRAALEELNGLSARSF